MLLELSYVLFPLDMILTWTGAYFWERWTALKKMNCVEGTYWIKKVSNSCII